MVVEGRDGTVLKKNTEDGGSIAKGRQRYTSALVTGYFWKEAYAWDLDVSS